MKTEVKTNREYSPAEFEAMGAMLQLIIKRAQKGIQYGSDMPSSRHSLINDIAEIAGWNIDGTSSVVIGGGK